jgi:hypothetical protein
MSPSRGYTDLPLSGLAHADERQGEGAKVHAKARIEMNHEDVVPDMYILGKALGGGLYPVSAVASRRP